MEKYFVFVEGKKVEVNEDVYRIIMRDEWREAKFESRSHRCIVNGKTNKPVFCEMNCSECTKEKISSHVSFELLEENRMMEYSDYPLLAEQYEINEQYRVLHEALKKLDKESRYIIDSIYFKNMTEQRVAEQLGVTQKAVNKRKMTILKNLKKFF